MTETNIIYNEDCIATMERLDGVNGRRKGYEQNVNN